MEKPIAVITGASRGIGLAAAHQLGRAGFAVLAVARDPDRLQTEADGLRAAGVEVESVAVHDTVFRISTANGPAATMALLDAAAVARVTVHSLSVASTTLDDVFVHYTGRALRDSLQEAAVTDSPFMMRRG